MLVKDRFLRFENVGVGHSIYPFVFWRSTRVKHLSTV